MREKPEVPNWALDQVRGQLRSGEEIINAVAFRKGARELVLVNTSRGAAIVTKGLFGDPHSAVLSYPRDLTTFRCAACEGRNVVIDVDTPHDVHCTHCGHPQHLVSPGEVRALAAAQGAAARTPKRPTRRRKAAAKKAPKKRATKRTAKRTTKKAAKKKAAKKKSRKATKRAAKKTATKRTGTSAKKSAEKAPAADKRYRPQCLAITPGDAQCRNSARAGSKYCSAHKGYQPPAKRRAVKAKDTVPRHKGARDTAPKGRKKAARKRTTAKPAA